MLNIFFIQKKNINNIKNFSFLIIVISIPFLDFIGYNLNSLNDRSDLSVNILTIKRLLSIFVIFFIGAIFFFYLIKKKINLSDFDLILLIGSSIYIFFQYNNIKNGIMASYIFYDEKTNGNQNLYTFFSEYRGEISLFILLLIFYLIFKVIKKKSLFVKYLLVSYLSLNFILGLFNVINASQKKYDGKVESIIYENFDFMEKSGKNIYFFIVDAMPPIEVADRLLKTDSSIFLDDLNINIIFSAQII